MKPIRQAMTDFDALRAAAQKATPGPWHVGKVRTASIFPAGEPGVVEAVASVPHYESLGQPMTEQATADAHFIALVRNDIDALLERLDLGERAILATGLAVHDLTALQAQRDAALAHAKALAAALSRCPDAGMEMGSTLHRWWWEAAAPALAAYRTAYPEGSDD